ncbi:Mitochondrial tRNA-specific 2-thiouridylase 1 isoform 3 [Schistosoma japonicum]|uniref:tRNA-5-taurinomethyluridine 2-sulfurtransferase n=1 Tax=Schistosoma japonicum TaxID=6182 RepID=A0A4Z2CR93_SCHJA|nr:Mitochondrial tRNA-specific 2-thiouridylase 1 isoform 3 [Schistosoma japonicum]
MNLTNGLRWAGCNLSYLIYVRSVHSVVCAVSGGVDSAVSAYLLKKKGFLVKGVFMTNWDALDEEIGCSVNKDRQDAQPLIKSYEQGATPNPDILCNRFVKFNMLTKTVLRKNKQCFDNNDDQTSLNLTADAIATGHYCQNSLGNYLQHRKDNVEATLLRSVDPVKDQTFWLSTVSHKELQYCMFPVGHLLKTQVKQIAQDIGLSRIYSRRESMGMCFIGKRRFSEFIDNYLEPRPGICKDFETDQVLEEHTGVHHFTLGQRVPMKRFSGPYYVCKMDYHKQIIYVVRDPTHPSLFMRKCWSGPAVWINSTPFSSINLKNIQFQWQNKWRPVRCSLKPFNEISLAAAYVKKDVKRCLSKSDNAALVNTIDASIEDNREIGPCLSIELEVPMRCLAPGQWCAFYDGNVCLGGAMICGSISLWEEGQDTSHNEWKHVDYELTYV